MNDRRTSDRAAVTIETSVDDRHREKTGIQLHRDARGPGSVL
jgi:hypothetical protein